MEPLSSERSGPVAGIVLAAGDSSRMGTNKLLLRFGEETVLRRSVRCAIAAGLDPVLVILGFEAERVRTQLDALPCRALVNPEWALGMNASLRAGIAAVPPEAPAGVVALADMPRVTPEMIAALVERYRGSGSVVVASDYQGILAPPTLFDRRLFAELQEREGEGCGRRVVERHLAEVSRVGCPPSALSDLDRSADYQRLLAEFPPG
ncbi:MAG TPA: nucleotidyltransferase family protein [Myxococcaceae bacterium]|nr:nucleotidyltransferase family protein [Myxococcaceae bacterium]